MMPTDLALQHASCVDINGQGVLILGSSGSGKSDLTLRLIDGGASLVADDQVLLQSVEGKLIAKAPEKLAGLLEVRGVGITKLPYQASIMLSCAIKITQKEERLPTQETFECLGVHIPQISLCALHSSTTAKIRMFLKLIDNHNPISLMS